MSYPYSGSCGAYLDLPADGSVPAAGLDIACNGFGAMSAVFRTADHVFYQKRENPNVVQIAELDAGFIEHGAVGGTTPFAILRLAYDESILIEGGQDGAIATYSVSPDGLTVAPLETLDIGNPLAFQAGVLVPCE